MSRFATALKTFAAFTLILGVFYPAFITGISQLLMHNEANGSLIEQNGNIIGSRLIAQSFTQPQYFHSRPSAINYDATNSGGSNLGPSNPELLKQVAARIAQVRNENHLTPHTPLPADMVLTSGSGLDPHISVDNALLQLSRVAVARHMLSTTVSNAIMQNIDHDFIGIWGKTGVNVLELNLTLDKLQKKF